MFSLYMGVCVCMCSQARWRRKCRSGRRRSNARDNIAHMPQHVGRIRISTDTQGIAFYHRSGKCTTHPWSEKPKRNGLKVLLMNNWTQIRYRLLAFGVIWVKLTDAEKYTMTICCGFEFQLLQSVYSSIVNLLICV